METFGFSYYYYYYYYHHYYYYRIIIGFSYYYCLPDDLRNIFHSGKEF